MSAIINFISFSVINCMHDIIEYNKAQLVYIKPFLQFDKQVSMFCILPCATIKDNVKLAPVGEISQLVLQMSDVRAQIRQLSDLEHLIDLLQKGEIIMARKVSFDKYLKNQVDLMRGYVTTGTSCPFVYNCYFTGGEINTSQMNIKQQWAFEIVMSRLNLCSIYHGGSFNHMRVIFMETANSYRENYKMTGDLIKNLQMTFQYFSEGYQPFERLMPVFEGVECLVRPEIKEKFLELNKGMIGIFMSITSINLAYIKIEKMRLLAEYKSCKESAFAVYQRTLDLKLKIGQLQGKFPNILQDITDYLSLAEIFFQILAYYYLLVEHQQDKNNHDYGFVKKQFQTMIQDNLTVIEEIERLERASRGLKQENDNCMFAMGVLGVVIEDVGKFKYRYNINVHENKADRPSLKEVIARRMGASNIWNIIGNF